MKNVIWIGRRQVRALIVLLALLPLIPTALLVHTMWQQSGTERILAIADMNEMYRYQLRIAAERFSSGSKAQQTEGDDLVRFLTHVFGEDLPMTVASSDGDIVYQSRRPISQTGFGYQIMTGRFAGWVVTLDTATEVPAHIEEQRRVTVRNAAWALAATILIAGGVWYAVHRGLKVTEIRKDLITAISHEIKTPVAAIKVLTESLQSGGLASREKESEYFQLIARENDRIESLADRFLTYARLERGQLPMGNEPVSAGKVVGEVLERMAPTFEANGGQLTWEGDRDLRARCDPGGLELILSNLIENALKYGGTPPRALVETRDAKENLAFISVTDNGKGISRDEQSAVFHAFYRSDGRLDDGQSGVGLGLAISRRAARLMKGSLQLNPSQRKGFSGCEFSLYLPRA